MNIKLLRTILWALVAVFGLGMGAMYLWPKPELAPNSFGKGVYALVDQQGQPIDQTMFVGQPSVLFFGFTHCPDVCPTTLAEISSWFETLGDEAAGMKAYFVTVDPERDTPAVLGDYVNWVGEGITGVTGEPAEIAKIAKAWGAHYEKVPLEGGGYTMDHTASVYLIDSRGDFQGTIAFREDTTTALGKLRNLLAKS